MLAVPGERQSTGHVPVLLGTFLKAASPISGCWIDGTLGAGGYTRALLDEGADRVIALDRDPECLNMAQEWAPHYGDRLTLVEGNFSSLDTVSRQNHGSSIDGVVLDVGLSSMQLDNAHRGFSLMRDGPLDMRMSGSGISAGDIVNRASEADLAEILRVYGEERASRRIAKRIVAARELSPITTTSELAGRRRRWRRAARETRAAPRNAFVSGAENRGQRGTGQSRERPCRCRKGAREWRTDRRDQLSFSRRQAREAFHAWTCRSACGQSPCPAGQ